MDRLTAVRQLLAECSEEQRRTVFDLLRRDFLLHPLEETWNVKAEVVMEAIARSGELTRRMFRGILAEAACKVEIIDKLEGWRDITEPANDPYDFHLQSLANTEETVRVQTKLQRSQNGKPLRVGARRRGYTNPEQFLVETQKTRGGTDPATGESTRPYRFDEFDILAVCMRPSTHKWSSFMFTVGNWLLPRPEYPALLRVYQPVSEEPDEDWTDSLATCIQWWRSGVRKTIKGGI